MIKVAIVGGTGYTGVELLRLLVQHPQVELAVITSRGEAGRPVSDLFPSLSGRLDLAFCEVDVRALATCDVVFFATPNGVAMQQVPTLLDAGARVVDLAADFACAIRLYGSAGTACRTPARSFWKRPSTAYRS